MKAILIDPVKQSLEYIDITNRDGIIKVIGYDTLESDTIGDAGDRLFFDEECFLRGTTGRFQIDKLIPVSGKGIIIGTAEGGSALSEVTTTIEDLRNRIKYL